MKYLFALFGLVFAGGALANESGVNSISCGEFLYVDRLTIKIDLKTGHFAVTNEQPLYEPALYGEGRVVNISKPGDSYTTFALYEKSKYVGLLKAIEVGQYNPLKRSQLNYKGKESFHSFYCHFPKSVEALSSF
jgi:hypothetical protein